MTGPAEFQPGFEPAQLGLTDLTFVMGVTATPGPSIEDFERQYPGLIEPMGAPLVTLTVQGSRFVACARGHAHREEGWFPMLAAWSDLADLAASVTGVVEQLPDDVRTRYLARYDRSLAAYRAAYRAGRIKFEEGGDR